MAITKEIIEDRIEVVTDYKAVQVRTATIIKEDGVELNRSFHRHKLNPCIRNSETGVWSDTDISNESAEVQAICNAVWTDEIKTAYKAYNDENYPHINPE